MKLLDVVDKELVIFLLCVVPEHKIPVLLVELRILGKLISFFIKKNKLGFLSIYLVYFFVLHGALLLPL